ncbi:MAG: hypothetical protein NC095_07825 [Muribaculum sp.]|nr:hypothetical protein [Muribaculum sp.]
MGKLVFNLEDYQTAAATFRKELLRLPLIGAGATLKYMTIRPGVRYEEMVGSVSADAEIAPYKAGQTSDANLNLDIRALRTYFGAVNAKFEPNSAIQTLLGHKASQASGDALASTPTAHEVLACIAKSVSHNLNMALWNAKRDANGKTTQTLFDGFDTISEQEIADGNISVEKGNLIEIDKEITEVNAVDVAKSILKAMDDSLRGEHCYMYCTMDFYDKYCEAYQLTHGGITYNTQYTQTFVEGSNGMLEIVPLSSKKGSKLIHVSPKANMLFGCDQMSDTETVRVKEYEPDILTLMMRVFAGCQFESIDKRRLLVAKIA